MARYKDRLRKGSFRGVEFFTDASDYDGGKRVQMHEFAGRSIPFTEDLGRKGRVYSVQGYLIGNDVFTLRDEFIRACERDGYGVLVHPYFGLLDVEAGSLRISENIQEGRIVRFTCDFHEKGAEKTPGAALNKVGKFFNSIDDKIASVKENFSDTFTVSGVPQYVLDSAIETVEAVNDVFLEVFGQLSDPSEYVANIKKSVLDFQAALDDLVTDGEEFANDLVSLIFDIGAITNSHKEKQEIYDKILAFDSDLASFPETTSTRTIQRQNQDALVNLIKIATYTVAMRDFVTAANSTFPDEDTRLRYAENDAYFSFSDIEKRQRVLFDGFRTVMTDESNNEIYEDLNSLSADMFASLPSPDDVESKIKRVVTYTPPETTSSLIVTYELYEAPDNEEDLIRRNQIENPCFVEGGQELEVLS